MSSPIGVLILHGFTGSLDTVKRVVPEAEKLGLPYRMPVLRGHGTKYEDLVGVTWEDWVADANTALESLRKECDQVVIVALSMGALCALTLAKRRPADIAGLVLMAPALRFSDPLVHLTPLLKLLFTYWDSPSSFHDKGLEGNTCTNYKKFPVAAFSQLLDFGHAVERSLGEVKTPVITLFSKKDQIIHRVVPKLLTEGLGGKNEVVWFENSGHEMLQDNEAEAVTAAIGKTIAGFIPQTVAG